MAKFYKLSIKKIQKETSNAVLISLNIPEHLKDVFKFKAGQYLTFKIRLNGKEIRRDYSICTAPNDPDLSVAIKSVENGVFSLYANTKLKTGDIIEVAAPNGRFIFEPNLSASRTIVGFAAGSGITPILSIVKTILTKELQSSFILIYGNKSPYQTMFYDELLKLKQNHAERFQLQLVFSQSKEDNALFGRIENSIVNYTIKNMFNSLSPDTFYICGPEPMIHNVQDTLIKYGVPESNILFELFTTTLNNPQNINAGLVNNYTKATVMVDDEITEFEMPQTKSILEVALAKNIDAPYSCQGGVCSSCLARLTKGKVTMKQNNILTDSELEEGLILTCQAYPLTPNIYVDYDDV